MQFKHHSQPPSSSGFTLVELLVVISVIALLVALLLPALGKAKYRTRQIQSLNNLHQASVATFLYAQDYQGYMPLTVRQDQGSNFWANFYIFTYPSKLAFNTIGSTILPYVSTTSIFMAPNHWDHINQTVDKINCVPGFWWYYGWYGSSVPSQINVTSYGYLPWLGAEPPPPPDNGGNGFGPTMRADQVMVGTYIGARASFNNVAVFCEANTGGLPNSWGFRDTNSNDGFKSVNYVNGHPDGGNVLFGDGSGVYVTAADYQGISPSPVHYVSGGIRDFNYDILFRQ